ncbi:MAG: hypothetical protein E7342_00655 [Clostridiales bacterium]|nr:hypothetical protein [Clostridiales bacterium]
MDLLSVLEVFKGYSLPIVIISIIIGVLTLIIEKLFVKRVSIAVLSYIPFILGIGIYSIYFLIFESAPFSIDAIYQGILCGALSTVYVVLIENLLRGSFSSNLALLTIQNGVKKVVGKENVLESSKRVHALFEEPLEEEILKNEIIAVLKEYSEKSNEDLAVIASVVIQTVSSLKK